MVKKVYSNIRGTYDFSASESLIFREVTSKAVEVFYTFGYEELILPLLEEQGLFVKSVGETTDIVERQMFKIEGKEAVLRPEGTAQVIRYYVQNSLYKKSDFYKFFYIGPMFRGERPQKGRLRQFNHIGAEAIGSDSLYLEAEIIDLCIKILESVGIKDKELRINTLGCLSDKKKFADSIGKSLNRNKLDLCDNCRKRLDKNPLRVLDCKNRQCMKAVESLDLKQDHLCNNCKVNIKSLLSVLTDLGLEYVYDPYLVRGLDYYTNTVFEVNSQKLGAQSAIGAGGRYDNLVNFLGGPNVPAVGFALGLERMLLGLDKREDSQGIDVFVAVISSSLVKSGFSILQDLRKNGIQSDYDYCSKSLKAQMRVAQRKKAKFVVIIGEDEWQKNSLILKDMGNSSQQNINKEEIVSVIKCKMNAQGSS